MPVVLLAASLIAGEAAGFMLCRFSGLWAWAGVVSVFASCIAAGWRVRGALYPIAVAVGIALAWHVEAGRMALDEYSKTMAEYGRPPSFLLKVKGDASCRRDRKNRRQVNFASSLSGVPVKVVAQFPEDAEAPADGEIWRCAGWLAQRKNAANRYAGRTLWVTDCGWIGKVADNGGRSADATYRLLCDSFLKRAGTGVEWSRELKAFAGAMLLGRKDGVRRERLAMFAAAGTIHVFAISGLHVMLIAGLLNSLLKALGLSKRMCAAVAIPMLAGYVMLIGAPPSAVRAALMAALYLGAYLFGRKPDSLAAWGVVAIVIFGVSPEMVLNVGCMLSFSVMLGIVLWIRWSGQFASPLDGLVRLASIEDALECERRKRIFMWLHAKGGYALGAFGISFAAWIAGAPIAAMVFGRLAFGSLLANVVVVPLAGIAVALGVLGLVGAFLLQPLAVLFNNLSALCIYLMARLSEVVAKVPFSSVETMPWSWLDCIMWYAAWFAFFTLAARHLPRKNLSYVREWDEKDD